MRGSMLIAVLVLAACGSGATPTTTPEPTRSDAQMAAIVRENIDLLWCGDEPTAEWCPALNAVTVSGGALWLTVGGTDSPESRALAGQLCQNIAATSYDADGKPIGYRQVHVVLVDDTEVGDCNAPDNPPDN